MSWTPPSITGYNASPPSDDGAQTSANAVAWATIKAKLADPLKAAIDAISSTIGDFLTPTGTVTAFAGSTAPTGWLLCGGQAVNRSTYSGLFAVIGTTFGSGDGSTTFNLPDLSGRAPFGRDDMNGAVGRITTAGSGIDGVTLGASGGNQAIPTHHHDAGTLQATYNDNQLDSISTYSVNVTQSGGTGVVSTLTPNKSDHSRTSTSMSGSTADTGTGSSANMPPALILNYIIKT